MQGTTGKDDRNALDAVLADMLVGNSPAIIAVRNMIGRVANSSAPVLICGPSGSGKEVVARAIHMASTRCVQSFVALNCGAIPAELIESELFGHERGAFTGAHCRHVGHFETADKGTLFLDEIGDMRIDMQVRLLRVLEAGAITRVGGRGTVPVDARIISATHQNLDNGIANGSFREDLFFRLGVVLIQMPDLASRIEDIPALVSHFQQGRDAAAICHFTASAIERLMAYPWRGNVRELRNIIERSNVLFAGETIGAVEADRLLGNEDRKSEILTLPLACSPQLLGNPINLKAQVETLELEQIQMALHRAEGIVSEAARLLTLKRTTLIEKMRKYGVERMAA